jgi:hypothetical protein
MDKVKEIRRLYYSATPATIQRDIARAVELLKSLPTDEERERAAVYMDGLAQMRGEWNSNISAADRSSRRTSARPGGAPRGRSDRS